MKATSQAIFPVWYRAQLLVPLLAVIYCVIPMRWVFSPVQLGALPYIIVGGSDWGGGNIFAFTKVLFWVSMLFGSLVNSRAVFALSETDSASLVRSLLTRHVWHIIAALVVPLGYTVMSTFGEPNGETVLDVWLLTAYFVGGMTAVFATAGTARARSCSRLTTTTLSVVVAIVWGFIPVGMG